MKKRILFVNDENSKRTIWDLKMEDVPQLAVQDLKTTCSKKIKHRHSTYRNSRILHIACHLQHEQHTSDVCHLKP